MNDNSSRFIKFLSLQFCEKKRTLAGGRIRYILFGYVLKRYINIEYWPDKDYIVNMEANVLSFLKSILFLIFHFYRTRASLRKFSELLQQWSWTERNVSGFSALEHCSRPSESKMCEVLNISPRKLGIEMKFCLYREKANSTFVSRM